MIGIKLSVTAAPSSLEAQRLTNALVNHQPVRVKLTLPTSDFFTDADNPRMDVFVERADLDTYSGMVTFTLRGSNF